MYNLFSELGAQTRIYVYDILCVKLVSPREPRAYITYSLHVGCMCCSYKSNSNNSNAVVVLYQ